ncbi:MAG: hypothetical protein ABW100_17690, partial [Candidatus Thiodiazotropha sp. 6PLUC3]
MQINNTGCKIKMVKIYGIPNCDTIKKA